MMMWLARCVLASAVLPRCFCAMAATGGSACNALACSGGARPLGTGTAQLVLEPLLTIPLLLLATLAATRGPMALALRSVYDYYYYYYYYYDYYYLFLWIGPALNLRQVNRQSHERCLLSACRWSTY
jgi:hypothetical protein